MPDEQLKLRPGMPLADRQALRKQILDQLLAQARLQAAEAGLSARCLYHLPHRAGSRSEAQRRLDHAMCQAESAGDGCLCEWHDEERAEGSVPAAELPDAGSG